MKNRFMKKALAVTLSAAMAFSVPVVSNLSSASAAAKVTLNATTKALKVGATKKLKLKNHKKTWKIKKVTVTKPEVVGISDQGATSVVIEGLKKGKATVKVKVKAAKQSAQVLKCKVTVTGGTSTPADPTPSDPTPSDPTPSVPDSAIEVSDEAGLNAALDDANIKTITFKTEAAGPFSFTKSGDVDLIVDAPNAEIENSATFKSIKIEAIKGNTWREKGKGNKINVVAKAARIIVEKGAEVLDIISSCLDAGASFTLQAEGKIDNVTMAGKAETKIEVAKDAEVTKLDVQAAAEGGKLDLKAEGKVADIAVAAAIETKIDVAEGAAVGTVEIKAAAKVEVSGTSKTAVEVKVAETAKNAEVTASTPVKVTASADMKFTAKEGAGASSVKVTGKHVDADIKSESTKAEDKIDVEKEDGTKVEVNKDNNTLDIKGTVDDPDTTTPSDPGTTTPGTTDPGTTTPGTTTPSTPPVVPSTPPANTDTTKPGEDDKKPGGDDNKPSGPVTAIDLIVSVKADGKVTTDSAMTVTGSAVTITLTPSVKTTPEGGTCTYTYEGTTKDNVITVETGKPVDATYNVKVTATATDDGKKTETLPVTITVTCDKTTGVVKAEIKK